MKLLTLLLALVQLVFFASCGDLFMKKESKEKLNQFATCEPDTSAISEIFTANIKGDLLCLGENLNLFADIVKSDRPGSLSYVELSKYIKKNVKDVDPSTYDILKAIFEFNSVLSGDDALYIQKANIDKLIETFVLLNKAMVQNDIYDYFTNEDKISYEEHLKRKAKIYFAFSQIEKAFIKNYKNNTNEIDFTRFVNLFEGIADKHFIDKVHSVLFIKKIFIGGNKDTLNAIELKRLINIVADASKIIFDIVHFDLVDHEEEETQRIIESLREDFDTIVRNIYITNGSEVAFELDDLFGVLNTFFPEYGKYTKYRAAILKLKEVLLVSNSELFTGAEIHTLLGDIILTNLDRGVFFFKAYAANEEKLNSPDKIDFNLPKVPTTNDAELGYEDDFNRIARDYAHFRGGNSSAEFSNKINRNVLGMFEIATIEDLVKRLFYAYGEKTDEAYGGVHISLGDMEKILIDFKDVLRGEGISLDPENGKYKPREANTAETISLLTSLFQNQSSGIPQTDEDDPKLIEVNEMTEFAVSLLSANSMATKSYDYFADKCELDEKGRFSPECYREKFLDFFDEEIDEGQKVKDYLPKLADYLESLNDVEIDDFLQQIEVFSRSCTYFDTAKTEAVPMSSNDFFMIFGGLIAMESTFNRFDRGFGSDYNNNVLDVDEVERAYDEVYEGAVKALIPGNFLKRFGKSFYFYLVKYNRLPDVENINGFGDLWRALKQGFHFVGFLFKRKHKKQSPASRYTLAMVLRILAEKSETNINNPFPCETLR